MPLSGQDLDPAARQRGAGHTRARLHVNGTAVAAEKQGRHAHAREVLRDEAIGGRHPNLAWQGGGRIETHGPARRPAQSRDLVLPHV